MNTNTNQTQIELGQLLRAKKTPSPRGTRNIELLLSVWRPLKVGQRVRVACKYRRGKHGVVKERLDNLISGMARYGVTLDEDPNRTTDFVRAELTRPTR